MGAILASPSRNSSRTNNPTNNNTFDKHSNNKNAPFGKFHIVQECFPSLAGKENKFFNEKVPAYLARKDAKCKKHKHRESWTLPNQGNTKEPFSLVVPAQHQKVALNSDLEKHFYGTLNLSETLKYIGCYIYLRCRNLEGLKPSIIVGWVRGVDRSLVLSGWQEMGFVSQPNMIMLYMLLREVIPSKVRSINQLRDVMMSTLYMCYAYNGHEISYPLKPFLFDGERNAFWDRCMEIINFHSEKLLKINKEAKYYNDIQLELKTFGRSLERKER